MAHAMERLNTDDQLMIESTINRKLERAAESLGTAAGTAVAKSREFVSLLGERADILRHRAERVGEEKPLQILAVLAGIFACAGVATRLWRANRNA
jgi:hypothetical protein